MPDDKDSFLRLKDNSQEIVTAFGSDIEWNYVSKKASSVCVSRECNDFESVDSQNDLFEWMCKTALTWKCFMKEYCRDMSRFFQNIDEMEITRNGKRMRWNEEKRSFVEFEDGEVNN